LVSGGHGVPFSKGLLAQSLTATGLSPEAANCVAMEVERQLLDSGVSEISIDELQPRVGKVLADTEGDRYYQRYRRWHQLAEQERPIIIVIGGATGVGKSTLATQLAHRLGIVRIISTDSIRQVMRVFFSRQLMPEVHYSSFDAGKAIRMAVGKNVSVQLIGFAEQVEMVSVGVGAIVERAISEGTAMVVEGVHVVPGLFPATTTGWGQALLLPMVMAVRDPELHRSHFLVRERETDGRRPFERYVRNFESIRRIQDFILERAAEEGTLVIDNVSIDDSVGLVVDALYELIEESAGDVALAKDGRVDP
jgi:2-phosphoglycerate kinase